MIVSWMGLIISYLLLCGFTAYEGVGQVSGSWDYSVGASIHGPPIVNGMARSGDGVVVYGLFFNAGGVAATNVAKWNGQSWLALGSLPEGYYQHIAASETFVFLAGSEWTASGFGKSRVVQFNGAEWSVLSGEFESITALSCISNMPVVAGVQLYSTSDPPVRGVFIRQNGGWIPIGRDLDGTISSMMSQASTLYVGGRFQTISRIECRNIAKWDGSRWSAMDSGIGAEIVPDPRMPEEVSSLAQVGRKIFAAGRFTVAGGVSVTNLAQWDGTRWSRVGSALRFREGDTAAITANGQTLWITGHLGVREKPGFFNIAKWDGQRWLEVPWDHSGIPIICSTKSGLYVAGWFDRLFGQVVNGIALRNNGRWKNLKGGLESFGWVNKLAVAGTNVLAAGRFHSIRGVWATNIAIWNGDKWMPLAGGVAHEIDQLLVAPDGVFVSGGFEPSSESYTTAVRKWQNGRWTQVGENLDFYVSSLALQGTNVFAGGKRLLTTNDPIRRWDGHKWLLLTNTGSPLNIRAIGSLAGSSNRVFAVGRFETVEENEFYLAEWNGTSWAPLVGEGASVDDSEDVKLEMVNGQLHMGGRMYTASGLTGAAARWNNTNWTVLVESYDGGNWYFDSATGDIYTDRYVFEGEEREAEPAKWDGIEWSAIGDGLRGSERTMLFLPEKIFAGGLFRDEDGQLFSGVAVWNEAPVVTTLRFQRVDEGLRIFWPAVIRSTTVETTTNLGGDVWRPIPWEPNRLGSHFILTNGATSPERFYRLKR